MNPFTAAASLLHLRRLTRVCPKCGERQVVSADQARQAVKCRRCGAEVPPPR